MNRITSFIFLITALMAGCTAYTQDFRTLLQNCPDFQHEQYKALPYLKAAARLQKMGGEAAIALLKNHAKKSKNQNKIILLCRLLFTANKAEECRRPGLGGAVFLGGTEYADWPDEPVAIVLGVPFLITRGYFLAGLPEQADDYLEYCVSHCRWREEQYRILSEAEAAKALDAMIQSKKFRSPLTDDEKDFFQRQIQAE